MTTNPAQIAETLFKLRAEHRQLDITIAEMSDSPGVDQFSLKRLKRRKLQLKDQIIYWESKIIPDLDA